MTTGPTPKQHAAFLALCLATTMAVLIAAGQVEAVLR